VDGVTPADPRRLPVVVGVAQLRNNRRRTLDDAREPLDLIAEAARRAIGDAARLPVDLIDGVDVVAVMTWSYGDLPGTIAATLGATPRRTEHSAPGGNQPVRLVDRAAARIASGEERAVLVCGGEARASLVAFERAGVEPPWSRSPGGRVQWQPAPVASDMATRYGIRVPLRGYPLYENALRARLGQTFTESQRSSAELLAEFSAVAATNDAAWDPVVRTVDEIQTVSPANRMLCFPYPMLMVAQPTTDQAAAVIVTSLAAAREHGVPDERIVHVWGGAGCADSTDLLARVDYFRSPAMEIALAHTLGQTGLDVADIDVADLYSCYPVVPKLAIEALGLRTGVPRTATGGLNAFGAPANNYSLHAVVAVASAIRRGASIGLVYGNGEVVTKHHAVVLADHAHGEGYVGAGNDLAPVAGDVPEILDAADGPAVIETYTVEHDRDGRPATGYVVGRTATGARFVAHAHDPATLGRLVDTDDEPIGTKGTVSRGDDGLNVFTLP
jgi:acetyl-CoA C-acetyltransferase